MTATDILGQALADELTLAVTQARPRRIRTPTEFAESEIIIPEGEWRGFRFATRRQPYARPLLKSFESDRFNRFASIGCVQSGKTLHTLVIPLAWHLAEVRETVIVCAPIDDINESKWKNEIKPVFEASPSLAPLLPSGRMKGASGWAREIRLQNGVVLRFMSAGGGDATRSSFTSRVVIVTEVDKMDEAGEVSEEADPITQFEARTEHYGHNKRIYLECTLSDEDGRMWQEYTNGTASQLPCPCPACGKWVLPERENLKGLDDARDEFDAEDQAAFLCPNCSIVISDDQRFDMVAHAQPVARGQRVEGGQVVGELPRTRTHGLRWSAFHNVLSWTTPHIGIGEWKCQKAKNEDALNYEDLEKKQCQFVWTLPYKEPLLEDFEISAKGVRRKFGTVERGHIPAGVTNLVMGVDVGKHTCWWVLLAGVQDESRLIIPAYGAFNPQHTDTGDERAVEFAMLASLREFHESTVGPGFVSAEGVPGVPTDIWIDGGYKNHVVEAFLREHGTMRRNVYKVSYGRGKSQVHNRPGIYHHPKKKTRKVREIGEHWYLQRNHEAKVSEVIFDSDHFKLRAQEAFAAPMGKPGSIELFRPLTGDKEHAAFGRHISNEKYVRKPKPKKGIPGEWEVTGQNHWLDALAQAMGALDRSGFRMVTTETVAREGGQWLDRAS